MIHTAGIDVGSGAVKAAVMRLEEGPGDGRNHGRDHGANLIGRVCSRIRKRDIAVVVDEAFRGAVAEAGVDALHYVATTGEGEDVPFATGHFYGMTTHARGALHLEPRATAVLDVGALHARALTMDDRGRVLNYKMTSQCASGSGQFLENIARYLGVTLSEVGPLSCEATRPEKISSICAVLAETDVINMVSRGISTPDILRGIHESMAGRYARLLRSLGARDRVFVSGGLAADTGLIAALNDALEEEERRKASPRIELAADPLSIFAGAIGAAIWGGFRYRKLELEGPQWTRRMAE